MNNHLLIGLGGTGGKILKAFKKRLWREFPNDNEHGNTDSHSFAFLYVDSSDSMVANPTEQSWHVVGVPQTACFTKNEFLQIDTGGTPISNLISNSQSLPTLKPIITRATALQKTVGNIDVAAGQMRRAGRIMFALKANEFVNKIKAAFNSLSTKTGLDNLHIMIFGGLCGGTGSGSIIDAICLCRKQFSTARIEVYAQYPEGITTWDKGRYFQNGYAALEELNALNCGAWTPYDVTSDRGAKYPNTCKDFGLVLYSERNKSGSRFQIEDLPEIVSNHVYHKVFTTENAITTDYFQTLSSENIHQCDKIEYNQYDGSPARTTCIASFGIKRIVYPEKKFKNRAAYELTKDAIYKLTFNNYNSTARCYANEKHTGVVYTVVKDNLERWKLTKEHLMLDKEVIQFANTQHSNWDSIWDIATSSLSFDDAKANDDATHNAIRGLKDYVDDIFLSSFRNKVGCHEWYANQMSLVHEYALNISKGVENAIYDSWKNGIGGYALNDLPQIATDIITHVRAMVGQLPSEQTKLTDDIENFQDAIEGEIIQYPNRDNWKVFQSTITKEDAFNNAINILYNLYCAKTEFESKEFEQALLNDLLIQFTKMSKNIASFVEAMDKAHKEVLSNIAKRMGVVRDMELYEIDNVNVNDFVDYHRHTKSDVDAIADAFRSAFTTDETNNSHNFGYVAEQMTLENAVCESVETKVAKVIERLHYNDVNSQIIKHPFLGTTVFDQLQNEATASGDPNYLTNFVNKIEKQSEVMLLIDTNQFQKNIAQVGQAEKIPMNYNQKHWLVSYPGANLPPQQQAFAQKLRQAFQGALTSPNGTTPQFDDTYEISNEITVALASNMLPIRSINNWDWNSNVLKEKYDDLIRQNPDNEMLLHSEDDIANKLPSLLLEVQAVNPEDFRMYLYIAAVEKFIESGMDNNNDEGWVLNGDPDDIGNIAKTLIGKKFTEIETAITEDNKNLLTNKVCAYIPTIKHLDGNARREKQALIKQCAIANLQGLNVASPTYKDFYSAMQNAIKLYD